MDVEAVKTALQERGAAYTEHPTRLMVQCLHHPDKTPSMKISKRSGHYTCYGCGVTGDYKELCATLGIEPDYSRPAYDVPTRTYTTTGKGRVQVTAHDGLADLYERDKRAYAYLKSRGITQKTAKLYDTRYIEDPPSIAIPIRTAAGKVVSLYSRAIDGDEKLKTHSTDSKLVLFGLDVVMKLWGNVKSIIAVEGEIDAMSCVQSGVPTVATMGMLCTPAQADVLSRMRTTYVLDRDVYERGDYYAVGNRIRELFRRSSGAVQVRYVSYKDCKDYNDVLRQYGAAALRAALSATRWNDDI
jgi:DNA primase